MLPAVRPARSEVSLREVKRLSPLSRASDCVTATSHNDYDLTFGYPQADDITLLLEVERVCVR